MAWATLWLLLITWQTTANAQISFPVQDIEFETNCAKGTDYLEKDLRHLASVRANWSEQLRNPHAIAIANACTAPRNLIAQMASLEGGFSFSRQEKDVSSGISLKCVNGIMKSNTLRGALNCQSDTDSSRLRGVKPACRSRNLVEHIQWWSNRAVECMDTFEAPITAEEVFKVLAIETAYHANINSSNGKGISQMVTDGAKAIPEYINDRGRRRKNPNTRGWQVWLEAKNQNRACQAFTNVMEGPENDLIIREHQGQDSILPCQFTNIRTNPARALMYGLILYKMAKQDAREQLEKHREKFQNYGEALESVTRLVYNAGLKKVVSPLEKALAGKTRRQKDEDFVRQIEREMGPTLDTPNPRYNYASHSKKILRDMEAAYGPCVETYIKH